MKLLKLVPDHTNLDFMRWRNLALVLSLIATVASLAFTVYRGLNLGVDFVGGQMIRVDLRRSRSTSSSCAARSIGCSSAKRASRSSAGPTTYQIRLPKPQGGDAAANARRRQVRADDRRSLSGRARSIRSKRCRARSARSWPRTARWRSASRCSGSRSTSGSGSNGSSASARWSRSAHDVAMTLGLFRLHPASGRPQRRRRVPDHRRLFAQRHGRHLRPDPRESAQVPEDGDPAAAQPVVERDAGANGGDLVDRADRARRADADRAGGHLRPRHRHLPRRPYRHLFVDLHFRRRCWSGSGSSPTASLRRRTATAPKRSPPDLVQQRPIFAVHAAAWPLPAPTLMRTSC